MKRNLTCKALLFAGRGKFLVIGFFFCAQILLPDFSLRAQDAETLASLYIEKYKNHITDAALQKKLNQGSPEQIVEAFRPFTTDSLPEIRSVSGYQISVAGLRSDKTKIRQKAVSIIIKGLEYKDACAVAQSIDILREFNPADFTPEHRYMIAQKVKTGSFQLDKLILLTGYLQIPDLIYNYKLMLNEKQYSPRIKMNIQFALARMGDTTAINFLKAKLTTLKVNDDVVYEILPLLAYARQKVTFDYLLENILSEEKNCLSSNPDKEVPIICAYRIMELVAPYIRDFPAKTERGELVSDDYNKTLTTVKEWVKVHKTDYTLNYEVY